MASRILTFLSSSLILVGIAQIPANAQDLDEAEKLEAFRECVTYEDNDERLACYDAAARGFDFEAASKSLVEAKRISDEAEQLKIEAEARAIADAKRAIEEEKKRLNDFGKTTPDKNRLNVIKATVVRIRPGKVTGTYVMLDNSQVWQQTSGKNIYNLKVGMTVTIKRGLVGGFMMTIDKTRKVVRMKRII